MTLHGKLQMNNSVESDQTLVITSIYVACICESLYNRNLFFLQIVISLTKKALRLIYKNKFTPAEALHIQIALYNIEEQNISLLYAAISKESIIEESIPDL